jgi:membrane protease YdiL (CAAX protease family)
VPTAAQLGVGAAAAAVVTAARLALLSSWPDFREATERSNVAALSRLDYADLLWVATLPAMSEELLFRGALLPAVYPDWCAARPWRLAEELRARPCRTGLPSPTRPPVCRRGVLVSGAVFGALHNTGGGRNAAFAAWAAGVGCVYGGTALLTGSIWAPVAAHALANAAAGALWMRQRRGE